MPGYLRFKKYFLLITCLSVCAIFRVSAQTCSGSLGDPIVNITFGAGSNFGPPLSSNTTSALQYQASTCPADGNYAIANYTSGCWGYDVVWHTATDHTGDNNGYFMLINASSQPSDFYIQTIDGLCAGTTYQFAAWLVNMCSVKGILPNITFTIEKTDGTILSTYNTNDIPIKNPTTWDQYGFLFTTPNGVSTVVLRMRNNAPGGMGNDLGLDDITFRPAGPAITTAIVGNAATDIHICTGDTTTFTFVSTVENCYANTAYQWQVSTNNGIAWSDIVGANSAAYTRLSTVTGNYSYRLLAAEAANINITTCRVASNLIKINVDPKPATTAINNGPNCGGDTVILTATGGGTYNWNGPGNFTASGNTVSINGATVANAGKYYVAVTNSFGCRKNDSTVVVVYAKPVASFANSTPTCEKNTLTFLDQSATFGQPLQTWNWNFGDGTTATQSSPTHQFSSAANYVVSLQVQNNKGCKSDTVKKMVTVHPLPKANFLLPAICLSDAYATFINTSVISDSSESKFLYTWNFGDANATIVNPNSSAQQSPKHSYTSTGVYPVHLMVTSKDGCVSDTTKNFTVNGAVPVAVFTIDSTQSFCSNTDIIITDSSSVNFGSITKTEIYWDFLNQPTVKITDSMPVKGKKYTHRYNYFGNPATKVFTIKKVVYSGISCTAEATRNCTIKASPKVKFDSLANICEEIAPFIFTQAADTSNLTGKGIYTGAGINSAGLFSPRMATPGTHVIRYTFTGDNSCTDFAEQPITVFTQPVVNAGPDRSMLLGGSIILNATATGDGLQYDWEPNVAIENNKVLTPKINPAQNITYTLQVSTAAGCKAADAVAITVLKDIYVPSAFSPNGDGINDTWVIPYLNSYAGTSVQVFNRYGQIVYYSTGNSMGWDGTYKGVPLPPATYVWLLNAGGNRKIMHGTVTIVR